ncbi:hypothetical protein DUNSADRAFT_17348 [Dunaliella salina]|uniref:Uncharacterized protein n=1 Tax=Dunaliella salina TaxID=3046 RepID=A0ABQ7H065_DUNSA|nr:hypothetical protein DUNSADRAFT_17348 [Dunaliella salina]|eukprot:KAF5840245.1 hypothetical protein DUNSADRAFT_17348 [Dunaliella salina]
MACLAPVFSHKRDLLRKMREPGFSPADLRDPSDLLDKANKLKGFVQQQNSRTGRSDAKKEWMLAAQQLQDEREAAERELQAALQATHDHACPEISSDVANSIATWQAITSESSQLRQELREQIKGISAVHSSLKAYGVDVFRSEASMVQQEACSLRQHLDEQLKTLEAELTRLEAESQPQGQTEGLRTPMKSHMPTHILMPPSTTTTSNIHRDPAVAELPSCSPGAHGSARPSDAEALQGSTTHSSQEVHGAEDQLGDSGVRCRGVNSREGLSCAQGNRGVGAFERRHTGDGSGLVGWTSMRSSSFRGAGGIGGGTTEPLELEDLLRGFPLVQKSTKDRVRAVFGALRAQHEEKLEEWQREAQATAAGANAQQQKAGQWPEDEHSWFMSMRERYWREMGPRGASREALMKKLASMMPKYSLADLLAHDEWHQKHKLLLRKRHGLIEAWRRERAQFLEDSTAVLQEATQLAVERAETAAERLVHELTRERVNEELKVLRIAAAEQAEMDAASKAEAEAQAEKERAAAMEAFQAEQAAKREVVAAYKRELEQREAQLAAAAAARAAEQEQLRAQLAPYHKARTEARKMEYKSKQETRKQALEAAAAEERARAARLDKLRELVAPHVEADPSRVLLPTEASMGVDEKGGAAFKEINGYTVDQLYRDQRFKVMEALQSAGLHQTNYARQVITAMPAAKPTRPDNLTAVQRGLA